MSRVGNITRMQVRTFKPNAELPELTFWIEDLSDSRISHEALVRHLVEEEEIPKWANNILMCGWGDLKLFYKANGI
jgi:hypothetical protein